MIGVRRSSCRHLDRGHDHATSRPSCPVSTNRRTWWVSARAAASSSRSAAMKPSFCQNGPDRRENNHARSTPASRAASIAKRASREPEPAERRCGSTATLRISACRPSALSSKPVLPTIRPRASRSTHRCTPGASSPASVRSAVRRNSRIGSMSEGDTRSSSTHRLCPSALG